MAVVARRSINTRRRRRKQSSGGLLVDLCEQYALALRLLGIGLFCLLVVRWVWVADQRDGDTALKPSPIMIHQLQYRSFPRHVVTPEELVSITHPAVATDPTLHTSQGYPTHIQVPKSFDELYGYAYGRPRIRQALALGADTEISNQKKSIYQSIGSFIRIDDEEIYETIFVSIASYRDPECKNTVEDLYARAQFPERLRVAIIEQRSESENDPSCITPSVPCERDPKQTLCRYAYLMDYYELEAKYGVGPVLARHIAHRFYRGEYYALQIDAHVRFTQHWDTDLIRQWKSASNEMAVLTTYMSDIQALDPETHQRKINTVPVMCHSTFVGEGDQVRMRHRQQKEWIPPRKRVTLEPYWAAGFSFARGHYVIQVAYDQHLPMIFVGEEISMSVRGFTHGYDYYAVWQSVAFHMYHSPSRAKVHKYTDNMNDALYEVKSAAMRRLVSLIGMNEVTGGWRRDDVELYGVGAARDPALFYELFGIDVRKHTTMLGLCDFVHNEMHDLFQPALRKNGMGLDYRQISYRHKDKVRDGGGDDDDDSNRT